MNERLGFGACLVIGKLLWWALHEIARRTDQRAADSSIQSQFGTTDRVDHNAGGIGRVPDFELQFTVQRQIAKACAFEHDIAPFSVCQPRNKVTGSDMSLC